MSDEHKTIHGKLDDLHALVSTVANHVIRLDQNVLVLAGRLDAIEPEVTGIKHAVTNLQAALVHVAKDVVDIREIVSEEKKRTRDLFDELGHHANGTNGHG